MSTQRAVQQPRQTNKKIQVEKAVLRYPFWFGGSASCFAACVTHPLDLGKFSCNQFALLNDHMLITSQSKYVYHVEKQKE